MKEIDWEQRRYEIVKEIYCKYANEGTSADTAILLADALIEELKKDKQMNKLGIGMIVASVLLLIGVILYKFWQAGATDEIVATLIIVLFIGGLVLTFTTDEI